MTENTPKYRNPRWIDKETRSLFCEILVGESYRPAQINVGNITEGLVNADFTAILEEFSEEDIQSNTDAHVIACEENSEKEDQQREVHKNRLMQEALFNMKLEAFEIPAIKDSDDKRFKKLIRKSKTQLEVQAYVTMLLQSEALYDSPNTFKPDGTFPELAAQDIAEND
jgi:hypothetical protein|tara:strand:- start:4248 stop:4754 length:507 start_codon:yes stop_codon:yes gene_type:complete